jgi:hypothetical protein
LRIGVTVGVLAATGGVWSAAGSVCSGDGDGVAGVIVAGATGVNVGAGVAVLPWLMIEEQDSMAHDARVIITPIRKNLDQISLFFIPL